MAFVVAAGLMQRLVAVVARRLDEGNDREVVFLVGVDPRVRHGQKQLVAANARNVLGVHQLHVGQRVRTACRARRVVCAGRFDGIQGRAHRRVADGVDVQRETSLVQAPHVFKDGGALVLQPARRNGALRGRCEGPALRCLRVLVLSTERSAALCVFAEHGLQVRQQCWRIRQCWRGAEGVALHHAVREELHRVRPDERVVGVALAKAVGLRHDGIPVDPAGLALRGVQVLQGRKRSMGGQFTLRLHLVVDGEGTGGHGRVLKRRDTHRVQALCNAAGLASDLGKVVPLQVQRQYQQPRFLVYAAGGFAIRADIHQRAVGCQWPGQCRAAQAHNIPGWRMGKAQGSRIERRVVAVGAHQLHGVVGRRKVQCGAQRRVLRIRFIAAVNGPLGHAQPFAGLLAIAGQAVADHACNLCERTRFVVHIAGAQFDDARGVHMRVDKARENAALAEAFDTGVRAGEPQRLAGRADERELAVGDREGFDGCRCCRCRCRCRCSRCCSCCCCCSRECCSRAVPGGHGLARFNARA